MKFYGILATFFVLTAQSWAESPCKGIKFGFAELIKPQGFFGLFTPKAKSSIVKDAFDKRYKNNRKYADAMLFGPKTSEGKEIKQRMQYMTIKTYAFHIDEVCLILKKRNIDTVSILCEAGTTSPEAIGGPGANTRLEVFCYLAKGDATKTSFKKMKQNRIAMAEASKRTDEWKTSAGKLIRDPKVRNDVYQEAISELMLGLYYETSHTGEYQEASKEYEEKKCKGIDPESMPLDSSKIMGKSKVSKSKSEHLSD